MTLREPLQKETVADVTYRDLVSIDRDATVAQAVEVMQREGVGSLLVLDAGRLAGIFTERDLLTRVLGAGGSLETLLEGVMTPDPTTARRDEPIHRVLARMLDGGHRHLPVLDDEGGPIGTISIKRAVHFLGDHLPKAIYNLPPVPGQYPDRPEGG